MEDGNGRQWAWEWGGVVSDPRACSGTHHPMPLPLGFPGGAAHTLPLLPIVAGTMNQAGLGLAGPTVLLQGPHGPSVPRCWKSGSHLLAYSVSDSVRQLGL